MKWRSSVTSAAKTSPTLPRRSTSPRTARFRCTVLFSSVQFSSVHCTYKLGSQFSSPRKHASGFGSIEFGSDGITRIRWNHSDQMGSHQSLVCISVRSSVWSSVPFGLVQFYSLGFALKGARGWFSSVRLGSSSGLVQFSLLGFQFAWVRSEGSPGGVCHLSETSGAAICFRFAVSSLVFLPNPVVFLPCPFALFA